jgi:surface carbohydrate biosynthesis protein (TIGR04326 family)
VTSNGVWYICDDFQQPTPHADVVVAWNEFEDGVSRHLSLPTILRNERSRYRKALLDFFRQLESSMDMGTDLIDALRLHNDLSYWWLTLVFAKRWGDLGVLPDAAKVLALADLLDERRPQLIIVALSDDRARRSVVATARLNGIPYETKQGTTSKQLPPAWIRATRTLVTAFRPFARKYGDATYNTVIADYLFRVEPSALESGVFRSQYWANLPEELNDGKLWLHRFTPHSVVPTRRHARRLLRRFNASQPDELHILLDDIHGLAEFRKAFRNYREIRRLHHTAAGVAARFRTDRADLWSIFEYDWVESFRGSHAMSMAILLTTLETTIHPVQKIKRGLYIFENQPWEAALLHTWKHNHRAPIVAVPHSTIRFWDVRYFLSSGTLGDSRFAQPDVIAPNSVIARQELAEGGWATKRLHEVEALMYLYLAEPDPMCGRGNDIVVLGELDHNSTRRYLNFVTAGITDLPPSSTVVFKAHPLVDATQFDLSNVDATVSVEPVAHLLRRARILVTGASGSTVLEALARGIPAICVLDPTELDLSSIREHPLLRVVGTADEFRSALRELLGSPSSSSSRDNFFHLDPRLERWKQLLRSLDSPQ